MKKYKEIVLTGGPCAGKTTGIIYISEKLRNKGWRVFTVPEFATEILKNGLSDFKQIAQYDIVEYRKIEAEMFKLCRAHRQIFNNLAKIFEEKNKTVIIYDRAEMDVKAYVGEEVFNYLLNKYKLNLNDVRDSYDGVVHLVTAALGAEEFYTCSNNKARWENLEEARLADEKILLAWLGHPHLKIIDNSGEFETKMKRLMKTVCYFLGIPEPLEIERKFLVEDFDSENENIRKASIIEIEQVYLISPKDEEIRIRKRGQNGFYSYMKTHKKLISNGIRYETSERLSEKEYLSLKILKDPKKKVINKIRYYFAFQNQYFQLDVFRKPKNLSGLKILEIELTELNNKVDIPPFIKVKKEVTDDQRYTNSNLAAL